MAWLRGAASTFVAFAAAGAMAVARQAPVTVMVWAPVDANAQPAVITPALWSAIVGKWVNAERIVPAAAEPTPESCRAAHALYYVEAGFSLRGGDLASSSRPDGRILARSHAVVVNCISQSTVYDHQFDLISAAPDDGGDIEGSTAAAWSASAGATLAKAPSPLTGVARIATVRPPLAYIDLPEQPANADGGYRIFARADGTRMASVVMPIVEAAGRRVGLLILEAQAMPQAGDYVEFVPSVRP